MSRFLISMVSSGLVRCLVEHHGALGRVGHPRRVIPVRLDLTRDQIRAYRLSVNGLTQRQRLDPGSLRRAAWAGLQDSMPRAAVLSLHARIDGIEPSTWEDPSLVQL